MTTLMVYAGPAPAADATRTGGVPLVPPEFVWPACSSCEGPMQFLAQVRLDSAEPADSGDSGDRAMFSVFMCQNDPGMCDDFDPGSGGNRAFVFGLDKLSPAVVPPHGATLLAEESAVGYAEVDADYEAARERWSSETGRGYRDVLGQVGGEPAWIQGDETPDCPTCEQPMTFVAQWEEGHDYDTAINFAGGCAYGFRCRSCATAAFLWQQ